VDYRNLITGEQLLRATGPEARVTFGGKEIDVGGLSGQAVANYLKEEWIDELVADPASYQLADWKEGPLTEGFAWKKRPEWLSRDLPWPAPGRTLTLRFTPPTSVVKQDGLILFEEDFIGGLDAKWKTVASGKHSRSSFSNEGKPGE
jgi:hypothetical protein